MKQRANWTLVVIFAYGGTILMVPLKQAIDQIGKTDDSIPLIFLITHGTVEDERDICNMVKDHVVNGKLNSPRICTFGIGDRTVVQMAHHELLIPWVLERMEKGSYGLNGLKFTLFISCILSQPHLKPIFSMKGSREKRGAAPAVKLTVKWAPYVYDPIPTSVSHVGINNRSSRHSKKNSRNKQKSRKKSSRGSKGKDKK
ncbi:hypothetical protein Tco_0679505 [Tanacetum coccineum]|uniref:Uncharacterized protein n=1 Tax=Tanacetum coccineum TaxID=301880 RepID=A0ABQ4XI70_9ASTR